MTAFIQISRCLLPHFILYTIEHLGSSCKAFIWNVAVLNLVEMFNSVLWISYYTKQAYPIWAGMDTKRLDQFVLHFNYRAVFQVNPPPIINF
jgi:hypothetical protein